jgi:hypothetical protein
MSRKRLLLWFAAVCVVGVAVACMVAFREPAPPVPYRFLEGRRKLLRPTVTTLPFASSSVRVRYYTFKGDYDEIVTAARLELKGWAHSGRANGAMRERATGKTVRVGWDVFTDPKAPNVSTVGLLKDVRMPPIFAEGDFKDSTSVTKEQGWVSVVLIEPYKPTFTEKVSSTLKGWFRMSDKPQMAP